MKALHVKNLVFSFLSRITKVKSLALTPFSFLILLIFCLPIHLDARINVVGGNSPGNSGNINCGESPKSNQNGYSTIQSAITASSAGDEIVICNGTYSEAITVNKDNLTIRSQSGDRTNVTIENGSQDVVTITNWPDSVILKDISIIQNGTNKYGIRVTNQYPTVSTLCDNISVTTQNYDAIKFDADIDNLTIQNSYIKTTTDGDGIDFDEDSNDGFTLINTTIQAIDHGIEISGSFNSGATIVNSSITASDRALSLGGDIWTNGLVISDSNITGGTTGLHVGGQISGGLSVTNSTISAAGSNSGNNAIYLLKQISGGLNIAQSKILSNRYGMYATEALNGIVRIQSTQIGSQNNALHFQSHINSGIVLEDVNISTNATGIRFNGNVWSNSSFLNVNILSADDGIEFINATGGVTFNTGTINSSNGIGIDFSADMSSLTLDNIEINSSKRSLDFGNNNIDPTITNSRFYSTTAEAMYINISSWNSFSIAGSCFTTAANNVYAINTKTNDWSSFHFNGNCVYAPSTNYLARSDKSGLDWNGNYWDGVSGNYSGTNIADTASLTTCTNSCGGGGLPIPIADYRFDECEWDGTAGEVKDQIGDYNATLKKKSMTLGDGKIQKAPTKFNADSYVQLPDNFPNLNTNFTITAWFKTSDIEAIGQRIFIDDASNTLGYGLSLNDDGSKKVRMYHRGQSNSGIIDSGAIIQNNTWYFVAAVTNTSSAQRELYVYNENGTLLSHNTLNAILPLGVDNGIVTIGGEPDVGETANRFKGSIDEVKVFTSALNQTTIELLLNNERIGKNYNGTVRDPIICKKKLTINDISVPEGNSGVVDANLTMTLSEPATIAFDVNYTTQSGTALGNSDFQYSNGSVHFGIGELSKVLGVKIFGDTKPENNETFNVVLETNATDVNITKNIGIVTIIDDDNASGAYQCKFYDFSTPLGTDWDKNGTFVPTVENGRLKLMTATGNKNSFLTQKEFLPPAKNRTVTLEFDFYAENGTSTPGDGIVVGLSDADITPKAGGYGGSIGYAQRKENATQYYGFQGGWIGLALDEYGNFSNKEGSYKTSGPGARKNSIALRGSGDKFVGYDYVMGTDANIFGSTNGSLSSKRYRMKIDGMDENKTVVSVEVNKNSGSGYESIAMKTLSGSIVPNEGLDVSKLSGQASIPSYFAVSFTSGTGGANRNYFIDNLEVCSVSYPEDKSDWVYSELSVSDPDVQVGETFTITVKVKNYGPAITTSSTIITGLPNSSHGIYQIISSSPGIGVFDNATGEWTIPSGIARFGEVTLTLQLKAVHAGEQGLNSNIAYINEAEPSDNAKALTIRIEQASELNAWHDTCSAGRLYTRLVQDDLSFNVGSKDCSSSFEGKLCVGLTSNGDCNAVTYFGPIDLNGTSTTTMIAAANNLVAMKTAQVCIKKTSDTNVTTCAFTDDNISLSSNSFAIRPATYTITTSSPIRAGSLFDFNATAIGSQSSMVTNYSGFATLKATIANPSCTVLDGNISDSLKAPITSLNFSNSRVTSQLRINEVGHFTVDLNDTNWTSVDWIGTLEDCYENNSSNVLLDVFNGKIGCTTQKVYDLNVSPHHFGVDANLSNFQKGSFTYLSNDLNMSASLDVNITAQNEDNITTRNYKDGCEANLTQLVLEYSPFTVNPSNSLTRLIYKEENHAPTLEGNVSIGTSPLILTPLPASLFIADGKAELRLKLNFDRSYLKFVNPFDLNITKATFKEVLQPDVNGSDTSVGKATFYYGRVKTKDITTDKAVDFNHSLHVEVFSQPPAHSSVLGFYQNTLNWWVNQSDGIIKGSELNATAYKDFIKTSLPNAPQIASFSNLSNGISTFTVTNPNKVKSAMFHLNIPSWLWYSSLADKDYNATGDCSQHPCFEYRFIDNASSKIGIKSGEFKGSTIGTDYNSTYQKTGVKTFR
jgi:hypothetical protein